MCISIRLLLIRITIYILTSRYCIPRDVIFTPERYRLFEQGTPYSLYASIKLHDKAANEDFPRVSLIFTILKLHEITNPMAHTSYQNTTISDVILLETSPILLGDWRKINFREMIDKFFEDPSSGLFKVYKLVDFDQEDILPDLEKSKDIGRKITSLRYKFNVNSKVSGEFNFLNRLLHKHKQTFSGDYKPFFPELLNGPDSKELVSGQSQSHNSQKLENKRASSVRSPDNKNENLELGSTGQAGFVQGEKSTLHENIYSRSIQINLRELNISSKAPGSGYMYSLQDVSLKIRIKLFTICRFVTQKHGLNNFLIYSRQFFSTWNSVDQENLEKDTLRLLVLFNSKTPLTSINFLQIIGNEKFDALETFLNGDLKSYLERIKSGKDTENDKLTLKEYNFEEEHLIPEHYLTRSYINGHEASPERKNILNGPIKKDEDEEGNSEGEDVIPNSENEYEGDDEGGDGSSDKESDYFEFGDIEDEGIEHDVDEDKVDDKEYWENALSEEEVEKINQDKDFFYFILKISLLSFMMVLLLFIVALFWYRRSQLDNKKQTVRLSLDAFNSVKLID